MQKLNRNCGFAVLFITTNLFAQTQELSIHLHEAEAEALKNSNRLASFQSDADAAKERADSQFSGVLPKLSLEGSYRYVTEVPNLPVAAPSPIPFGSHSSYSIGPMMSYTLWDTGSARKTYGSFSKLAESREEERKNAQSQILFSVRTSYVRVSLSLKELKLVNDSLALAVAQEHDISTRFQAGASSRLDVLTAHRQVLSDQLQVQQKKAELESSLRDLFAWMGRDVSSDAPDLKLDSLEALMKEATKSSISPPDRNQPLIHSQELYAQSSELSASSQKASLFPMIMLSAKTSLDYPDGPVLKNINQNTFMATLSMPLFEGGKLIHEARAKRKEAEAARFRAQQMESDLQRDFSKATKLKERYMEQKELAAKDVAQSEEVAKLFYSSYKAGKINLTEVQVANVQALQSKVNAARIDAQILLQYATMKALSGKETQP